MACNLNKAALEIVHGASTSWEQLSYYNNVGFCESPIEELMLAGLVRASVYLPLRLYFCGVLRGNLKNGKKFFFLRNGITIYQQFKIRKYRADFFIVDDSKFDGNPSCIVVECDGHDFHERTKDQAARDRKRDREFQLMGYKVLRFTGSEIVADAGCCAKQVMSAMANAKEFDYLLHD